MSAPDEATLSSRIMATITAARAIYSYDASLDAVYARAEEQRDEAAREDFTAPETIDDGVIVLDRGQRRDLR